MENELLDHNSKEELLLQQAKKRVKIKRDFRSHLVSYSLVNSFLTAICLLTTGFGGYFWPIWTMLGWGLGLAFHASSAYMDLHGKSEIEEIQREYLQLKEKFAPMELESHKQPDIKVVLDKRRLLESADTYNEYQSYNDYQ